MLKQTAIPFVLMMTLAVPALAAQSDQQAQQQPKPAEAAQKPGETPPKPAESTPRPTGLGVNVRLDVTITDQRGTAAPTNKTVTMVLADRANGRIRTSGDVRTPQGYRSVTLNVDAFPMLLQNGRVQMNVTLEFRPTISEGTSVEETPTAISESINVILEDGKPLVVSQSADPNTDRKVRVELKASILK